jgi:hypothetical protein
LSYRYQEKAAKNVGKGNGKFRSVQHSSERCVNVIAVLENVHNGERQPKAPQMLKMPHESGSVIDRRASIEIAHFWARNEGIGRASSIGTVIAVRTVNTYASFSFTDRPLDGIKDKTENEIRKETRKVDMKRLLFLLRKLSLHLVHVGCNGRVIIILIPGRKSIRWTIKPA